MNFFRSKPKTPSTYNPLSANAIQIMNKYTVYDTIFPQNNKKYIKSIITNNPEIVSIDKEYLQKYIDSPKYSVNDDNRKKLAQHILIIIKELEEELKKTTQPIEGAGRKSRKGKRKNRKSRKYRR